MSKSPTIIDGGEIGVPADRLHNPHAGEMLALDFMEPLGLSDGVLAAALGVDASLIEAVVSGARRMTAELDLRLARYFRMSPGFFLGLQLDYELMEARRSLNGALDHIIPRAA